jgi:hypothetical protein
MRLRPWFVGPRLVCDLWWRERPCAVAVGGARRIGGGSSYSGNERTESGDQRGQLPGERGVTWRPDTLWSGKQALVLAAQLLAAVDGALGYQRGVRRPSNEQASRPW